MADDNDTPATPAADGDKPAPRRRAAPRKTGTTTAKSTAAKSTTTRSTRAKGTASKGVIARAEGAASKAVTGARDVVADTASKAVGAVKPRSTKRATPRPAAKTGAKASTAKTSRGTSSGKALDKVGGAWGAAAIAGGVAAAAGAALLTLRGSSGKNLGTTKKPIDVSGSGDKGAGHPQTVRTAHQADGTDSSKSFNAGIADEGTIPGKA